MRAGVLLIARPRKSLCHPYVRSGFAEEKATLEGGPHGSVETGAIAVEEMHINFGFLLVFIAYLYIVI